MRRRSDGEPAGSPSTVTVPLSTTCEPTIARMRVVLPLPLGPSRPTTCPTGTLRSSDSMTAFPPRTTRNPRTSIALFPMQGIVLRAHVVRKPYCVDSTIAARNRSGTAGSPSRTSASPVERPQSQSSSAQAVPLTVAATSSSSPSHGAPPTSSAHGSS